jgi:hypothetical protein
MTTRIAYLGVLTLLTACNGPSMRAQRSICTEVTPPVDCPNENKEDVTVNLNRNVLGGDNPENSLNPLTACVKAGGKITINITPVGQPADPGTVFVFPKEDSMGQWDWLTATNAANQTQITIDVPEDATKGINNYVILDKEKGCLDPRFHVE